METNNHIHYMRNKKTHLKPKPAIRGGDISLHKEDTAKITIIFKTQKKYERVYNGIYDKLLKTCIT